MHELHQGTTAVLYALYSYQAYQIFKKLNMSKLCSGCGETKGNGRFTEAQWKMEVGGICCKCNAKSAGAAAGGDGGGSLSHSARAIDGKKKDEKSQQCASPSCGKVGKGYKLCRGCMCVYYCSER